MIWAAFVFLLFAVAALFFSMTHLGDIEKRVARVAAFVTFTLSLLFFVCSCVRVVDAGKVGIPVLFGSVENYNIDS